MKRIGVDSGGTFTDAVLWDEDEGLLSSAKVSSRRDDPAGAVVAAAARAVANSGVERAQDLRDLVHGTTIGTNAVLERTGPRIALLTTEGFRDVLEIGRLTRPPSDLYDLLAAGPHQLVSRRDRFGIAQRLDQEGKTLVELDEQAVRDAADTIASRRISSVAVCYLYSFLNPEHERRTAEILREHAPGLSVSLSSDVLPQIREFERTSTTALNAYLVPVTSPYLQLLQAQVEAWQPGLRTWIMQSNGGVTTAERAAQTPVNLLLSGPSGGVVAGRWIARQTGVRDTITIDMGGTSFDVCLLADSAVPLTKDRTVLGMPVRVPTVDIATIGTGGGSIGHVDSGGQFLVGPRSAAAHPGPAAYGRGGVEATVTDANVVLGILRDGQLLGDEVTLDYGAAFTACERLGKKLGLDAVETALGIRRISNAAMAGAVRAISVGHGHDPRNFALNAFGGAGPMHATDIAAELAIPVVIVPPVAGCLSAVGMVVSDVVHTHTASCGTRLAPEAGAQLKDLFDGLVRTATDELTAEGIPPRHQTLQLALDLQYSGQNSSVTVAVKTSFGPDWVSTVAHDFHAAHERINSFSVPSEPIDVVSAQVMGIGTLARTDHRPHKTATGERPRAHGTRRLTMRGGDQADVPVYQRADFQPGTVFTGPAIVESADTTLVVPPHAESVTDAHGNLILHLKRGV